MTPIHIVALVVPLYYGAALWAVYDGIRHRDWEMAFPAAVFACGGTASLAIILTALRQG